MESQKKCFWEFADLHKLQKKNTNGDIYEFKKALLLSCNIHWEINYFYKKKVPKHLDVRKGAILQEKKYFWIVAVCLKLWKWQNNMSFYKTLEIVNDFFFLQTEMNGKKL